MKLVYSTGILWPGVPCNLGPDPLEFWVRLALIEQT